MGEDERGSVEEVSRQGECLPGSSPGRQFPWRTVKSISDDGMPQRGEMDTNLVSASGVNFDFQQSEPAEGGVDPLEDFVVGDGFAASLEAGGHASASQAVAADGGGDGAMILFKSAVNERNVRFFDFAARELGAEAAVGIVIFGDEDEAAGGFVEAMDNTGTKVAADRREMGEAVQ